MIGTRKNRTTRFIKRVKHEWKVKYSHFIENTLEKPWDWSTLSENPNSSFDIVLAHLEKPWEWSTLSQNPNIPFDEVLAHPEKPWN